MRSFLTRKNIILLLSMAAIVAMATWTPQVRQNFVPVTIDVVARLNNKLPDGTLSVPNGGVILDDGTVLETVQAIGRRGDVLISNGGGDETYQIVWLREENHYLLSIQKEPFERNRDRAATEYLAVVGKGSIEEACTKRSVSIEVASWLDPKPPEIPGYCIY